MNQKKVYSDLLDQLNKKYNKKCIRFYVYDHEFPDWYCNEEDICEMDHINHRWSLIKEHIGGVPANHGMNICNTVCRKKQEVINFHDTCELVNFIKFLLR